MKMSKMKKLTGSFRYTQWDPCLIISQIIALQCLSYLSLSLLIAIVQDVTGSTRTLDHIFEYHEIHIKDSEGCGVVLAFVLNAVVSAFLLRLLVGRTKLCLDFSCTLYGVHAALCCAYNGAPPAGAGWWALAGAGAALTCVTAELLCLRDELRDIPLAAKVDL